MVAGLPVLKAVRESPKAAMTMLVDLTRGRQTRGAVYTDTGHIILTNISPQAIHDRLKRKGK